MAAGELGRLVSTEDGERDEEEYRACLREERAAFAWVLERHGERTPERARAEALAAYPYEPPAAPYRGLVFHDEAWHWAMLHLHGPHYWRDHPGLATPSREYERATAHLAAAPEDHGERLPPDVP
ncbi:hypothetical protein SSBG_05885 [Streptomyces sp. SPB074]|nr:hypothetical protein SSBG_05885 [Streptomyces sp. SPB074]